MNIGNVIGFIGMGIAIIFAVNGEWGWAVGAFIGGAALGGLANMLGGRSRRDR